MVLWVSLNSVHLDSQQTKELHITLTATSLPPLSAIGTHTLSDFDRVTRTNISKDFINKQLKNNEAVVISEVRDCKTFKICTLLDKKERRTVDIDADYVGFDVPNEFVVGYGLDYDGKYRNLEDIGVLKPEIYK